MSQDSTAPPTSSPLAPVAACLAIFAALVDSQVVGAIAPQIAEGLGVGKTVIAQSVTGYAIAAAAVALGLGRFAGRVRPARWLPAAAAAFGAASLLAALAPHLLVFLGARVLAGVAGGLISALAIAALADASSYEKRGRQMIGVAISYFLAPVIGVPAGAFLTDRYGWRTVFFAAAALSMVAAVLVHLLPLAAPPRPAESPERVSLRKMALRSRSTRMGILSAVFVSGGLVGFTTFLGTWLSDAFGATARDVGLVYALAGVGAVAGGVVGGTLADRFGKRRVAVAGSAGMALLLLVLPSFARSPTLLVLIAATAILAAIRVAPLQALITELVDQTERAAYIALRNGASQLGIALTVTACGLIYGPLGMPGVGALCAALTLGAWITTRLLDDPRPADLAPEPVRASSWPKRIAASALVATLVVFVGLPWLFSLLFTKATTNRRERTRTETPAAYGAEGFEDVTFTTADGVRLSGWYLPSRGQGVTLVFSHGQFRSRYELLERAVALWQRGYGVLLYDLRRHGASGGEFSTFGYFERYDVLAAAGFARERAPGDRVALVGISMGAAATLMAAPEAGDILAVVAESSFLSFTETVTHHIRRAGLPAFPVAYTLIGISGLRLGFSPSDFDVRRAVERIDCPVLFVGGTEDIRMPTATTLDPLHDAARNPLKRKLVVSGATHGHSFEADREAWLRAVTDFLDAARGSV